MEKQWEEIERMDVRVLEIKSYAMEGCFSRWKEIAIDLKSRDPYTPFSLNKDLFIYSMCKEVIIELRLE